MNRPLHHRLSALAVLLLLIAGPAVNADTAISVHGERALALQTQEWQREETEHFVIHYAQKFIGRHVALEAEFYHRFVTAELGIDAEDGERSHIFIFESQEGWQAFARETQLEAWTGAVTIDQELFVPRYPEVRFKGNALGHEVVHLVVNRYITRGERQLPLWLSEGYAEDVSARAYSIYMKRRGYRARMLVLAVAKPYPLEELMAFTAYPEPDRVADFYRQSRQLVGFMRQEGGRERFADFFRRMAAGTSLEQALRAVYLRNWSPVGELERAFEKKMVVGSAEGADPRPERDD